MKVSVLQENLAHGLSIVSRAVSTAQLSACALQCARRHG